MIDICRFMGGPLHGQVRAVRERLTTYRVPIRVSPMILARYVSAAEPVPDVKVQVHIYTRQPTASVFEYRP